MCIFPSGYIFNFGSLKIGFTNLDLVKGWHTIPLYEVGKKLKEMENA